MNIPATKRLKMMDNISKDVENAGGLYKRTLHVEATGITKAVPDFCHILIQIVSQKLSVSQAKDSVERRLVYVKQTIQNCQIQVGNNVFMWYLTFSKMCT